jgi:hypothetical protein
MEAVFAEVVAHCRACTMAVRCAHDRENSLGAFFAIDRVSADYVTVDKINVGAFVADAAF